MAVPEQSKKPPAAPLAMSSASAAPTARSYPLTKPAGNAVGQRSLPRKAPIRHPAEFQRPKLRLKIQDLWSPGAADFQSAISGSVLLKAAVYAVVGQLYGYGTEPPLTRSVTLVLRSMNGVAYTVGTELDDDHKEIHFSTNYIEGIASDRKMEEIKGVVTHEMVHCYQFNGYGTAPGGLIEGIADWVRLKSELGPPHWNRSAGGDWDAGYEHTAYFLEWLETKFGEDIVPRINERLRKHRYNEATFWHDCCGRGVHELWEEYGETLNRSKGDC
ncbi:MAG: hypothetical protein M1814_003441 [Vezdaea aestivalis]|nr:MAG: hypothetical protein M1814_003441 [Vezdaea aestivalis]